MFSNDLTLLHRPGPSGFGFFSGAQTPESDAMWFSFRTCMRHIVIGDSEVAHEASADLREDDEIYRGDEAYRFLLQVVCGLHSPLIGETEVNGQFKNEVARFKIPSSPWGVQLKRFFKALFEDAKMVRQRHLVDLGSQSYGSILRRELRNLKQIHILGAGHLVQEILPWICKDGNQIHVHCRDPKKARQELAAFASQVELHSLEERGDLNQANSLIIAAPVTGAWVSEWLPEESRPEFVADLRADSNEDRVSIADFARVLSLPELLMRISENQAHLQSRKEAALQAINDAVLERARFVEYRPFGWEDVCA